MILSMIPLSIIHGIIVHDNIIQSKWQLYEMIHVQHGIMLVGEPMSCKTKLYEVLADTLTHLSEKKGAKHQVLNLFTT